MAVAYPPEAEQRASQQAASRAVAADVRRIRALKKGGMQPMNLAEASPSPLNGGICLAECDRPRSQQVPHRRTRWNSLPANAVRPFLRPRTGALR